MVFLVVSEMRESESKSMFSFNFHLLKEDFSRDFRSDSREQLQIATDEFGRKAPKKTFEWMERFLPKSLLPLIVLKLNIL